MVIDGPCMPQNSGERATVRICMSMDEAARLEQELRGVVLQRCDAIKELIRGLERVKSNARENEVVEAVAKLLRGTTLLQEESSRTVAYDILRTVNAMREP